MLKLGYKFSKTYETFITEKYVCYWISDEGKMGKNATWVYVPLEKEILNGAIMYMYYNMHRTCSYPIVDHLV